MLPAVARPSLIYSVHKSAALIPKKLKKPLKYLNVDGDQIDEGLFGGLAVVRPAGDPDNVIVDRRVSNGWSSRVVFISVGGRAVVFFVGPVRDLDLNVKVRADLLNL